MREANSPIHPDDLLTLTRNHQAYLDDEEGLTTNAAKLQDDAYALGHQRAMTGRQGMANNIRAACDNAVEVFADEANAAQCREVAEYMREVLLARLNTCTVGTGLYSSDPLACSGCVSGCFRCSRKVNP